MRDAVGIEEIVLAVDGLLAGDHYAIGAKVVILAVDGLPTGLGLGSGIVGLVAHLDKAGLYSAVFAHDKVDAVDLLKAGLDLAVGVHVDLLATHDDPLVGRLGARAIGDHVILEDIRIGDLVSVGHRCLNRIALSVIVAGNKGGLMVAVVPGAKLSEKGHVLGMSLLGGHAAGKIGGSNLRIARESPDVSLDGLVLGHKVVLEGTDIGVNRLAYFSAVSVADGIHVHHHVGHVVVPGTGLKSLVKVVAIAAATLVGKVEILGAIARIDLGHQAAKGRYCQGEVITIEGKPLNGGLCGIVLGGVSARHTINLEHVALEGVLAANAGNSIGDAFLEAGDSVGASGQRADHVRSGPVALARGEEQGAAIGHIKNAAAAHVVIHAVKTVEVGAANDKAGELARALVGTGIGAGDVRLGLVGLAISALEVLEHTSLFGHLHQVLGVEAFGGVREVQVLRIGERTHVGVHRGLVLRQLEAQPLVAGNHGEHPGLVSVANDELVRGARAVLIDQGA